MIDFNSIITGVLIDLQKTDNVLLLEKKQLSKLAKFKRYNDVFKVNTEILGAQNKVLEVIFYVCFNSDFPASIPSIYLDEENYDSMKYIPHVDTDMLVCTFDNATTTTDINNPAGITRMALRRAKRILEEGLLQLNKSDFAEEFLSYWENNYNKEYFVKTDLLSFIKESPIDNKVSLLILKNKLSGFKYILSQNNSESNNFMEFLENRKIEYSESDIFFSSQNFIKNEPPFNINVREGIKLVDAKDKEALLQFLNKKNFPKLVLYCKNLNGASHYIGWFYPPAELNKDGFRIGVLTPVKAYETFQSGNSLIRVSPQPFTNNRMKFRSEGVISENSPLSFCIAGLGSIGSHLVHFLESFQLSNYNLIDPEFLSLENTARHLLGFNYIRNNKAHAMKDYLSLQDPRRKLKAFPKSILDTYKTNPEVINDSDYMFLIVGRQDVEETICNKIKDGSFTSPIFIVWVEPYLYGGHCLYLHPNDFKHEEYYENLDGLTLFKSNVIHSIEYTSKNELLTKKEASCQSSFMPYSEGNILHFLSNLFIEISTIIKTSSTTSKGFTWVGDLDQMESMGINKSEFHSSASSFSMINF